MGTCGPDFDCVVVDACTGDPIPGATVTWWTLGPYPAYPGGPIQPCAATVLRVEAADGVGAKVVDNLWMTTSGISQHRVSVSSGEPGEESYRSGAYYLDNSMIGSPIELPAFPVGNCPPDGDPGGTGAGSCGACGELTVVSGPRSTWPMGADRPVDFRGMGQEPPEDRCTSSPARVVTFAGKCFPGVEWVPLIDQGGQFGAAGSAPMDWHQVLTVDEAGAATAGMVRLLMDNQAYLSTQLFTLQVAVENLGVWANQMNEALNGRLLLLNESLQLLGTVLHGEGWLDRVHVTREDPYPAIHPPFGEGP